MEWERWCVRPRALCVRCAHQRPDGSGAAVQGGRRLPVAARRLTVPPAASSNPTRLRRAGLLSHGQGVRVRIVAAFPSLCAEGLCASFGEACLEGRLIGTARPGELDCGATVGAG